MRSLLNRDIVQCAMDADFDNHFDHKETVMAKDLHGVEIKHPHASASHHGGGHAAPHVPQGASGDSSHHGGGVLPHHDHPGHHLPHSAGGGGFIRQAEHPHHTIHYHSGPEHHHYHHAPSATHTTPHGVYHGPYHHPGTGPHTVRHHVVPHWNVGKGERHWQADRTPWRDEGGIWHSDHKIFIDDEGVWWDDYGRWRDAEGIWHLPENAAEGEPPLPYYNPLDSILNQVIVGAANYVAEKTAEEVVKKEAETTQQEGEKND